MSVNYAHADVLDYGLSYIRDNCNKIALIDSYTFGDSYATVVSNMKSFINTTTSDFTISSVDNDRILTTLEKDDPSAMGTSTSSTRYFAFLDTSVSQVLVVISEEYQVSFLQGDLVTYPVLTYRSKQPKQ